MPDQVAIARFHAKRVLIATDDALAALTSRQRPTPLEEQAIAQLRHVRSSLTNARTAEDIRSSLESLKPLYFESWDNTGRHPYPTELTRLLFSVMESDRLFNR
jgi:hypothetical protein